jgi:hypothetical protein
MKVNSPGNGTVVPDDVISVVVKYSTCGLINGTVVAGNDTDDAFEKSTIEADTVNDPVITADPENGNGSTPVNPDPSPTNDPENDPEYILLLSNELVT